MPKPLIALLVTVLAAFGLSYFSDRIDPYYLDVMTGVGINIILAVSLNLVNGYTGQFSLGHAGFMSVGAYLSAGDHPPARAPAARRIRGHRARAGDAVSRGSRHRGPRVGDRRAGGRHPVPAAEGRLPRPRHPRIRRNHPRGLPEYRGARRRARAQRHSQLHDGLLGLFVRGPDRVHGGLPRALDLRPGLHRHPRRRGRLRGRRPQHHPIQDRGVRRRGVLRRHGRWPLWALQAYDHPDRIRLQQEHRDRRHGDPRAGWATRPE